LEGTALKEHRRKAWIDIKKLRTSRGWRQWETADKLGISRAHLSSLESGKRGLSIPMMDAIIQVFGVEYDDFYAETERGGLPNDER
jgi:transcriptional regulator with XRE-family HTH domain